MLETKLNSVPETFDEAVETLMTFYVDDISTIRKRTESEFLALAHFAAGTFVRHTWCLFWFKDHPHESWPKEKPILVQFFNDMGIRDANSMSEAILSAFYQKVQQMP